MERKKFEWKPEHMEEMKKLKEALREAGSLKKLDYKRPVLVTVDRVVDQLSKRRRGPRSNSLRSKVLNDRQQKYV